MVHEDDAAIYDVTSLVCWRCRASGMAAQDAAQANGGQVPPGRYFTAQPRR